MKILVVGNGEGEKNKIIFLETFKDHDVDFLSYDSLVVGVEESYDRIILSGGRLPNVENNALSLIEEEKLILRCTKPILAICYGFEVLMHAYKNKVSLLEVPEHEIITIKILKQNDPLLEGVRDFKVWENHKYSVQEPVYDFDVIAKSDTGIEIVRHKSRKIYGVQFHPESINPENTVKNILTNFLYTI